LICWNKGQINKAKDLFDLCTDKPNFAPFYLAKAKLFEKDQPELAVAFCQRAIQLDNTEWRAWIMLADYYTQLEQPNKAVETLERIYQKNRNDYRVALPYAKALLNSQNPETCLNVLKDTHILPYEGAAEGRDIYHKANLLLAIEYIKAGEYQQALIKIDAAKKWPEHLGAGKPYDVDTRPENYLELIVYKRLNQTKNMEQAYEQIRELTKKYNQQFNENTLLSVLALLKMKENEHALVIVDHWLKHQPDEPLAQLALAKINNETEQKTNCIKDFLLHSMIQLD
jgi:tetratricopeptide (TPR) repeat protein